MENDTFLNGLLEIINQPVYTKDDNFVYTYCNQAFVEFVGFSKDKIIGSNVFQLYNPENAEIYHQSDLELFRTGGVQHYEAKIEQKGGVGQTVTFHKSVLTTPEGKKTGIVGIVEIITELKKKEQELTDSESKYKKIFENVQDIYFQVDLNGLIKEISPSVNKYSEYTREEIIGKPIELFYSNPEDRIFLLQEIQEKGEVMDFEILLKGKNAKLTFASVNAHYSVGDKGQISGVEGTIRDLTERKQALKALKESEEKYRLLIENQGEGLTIVDPEENLIFVNPAAEAIFGVEPGMLAGQNLKKFIAPEQFALVLKETGKRTKNEKSSYELDIITPLGIRRNILVTATPQTDENGKFIGTFGVLRDITERKEAEELLRRSETKYRNLIETMPDGVYRSTHDGQFVEVNPAMVEMLGYETQEELMAIDIKSQLYFAPEDRESLVLDTEPVGLDVFPMKKKDGSTVWIEDHGWYIRDDEGKILFHEGILRDVTERKMIELQLHHYSKELQELNATKDKFFSIIAHDLKNPFNSIIGLSEILKDEAKHIDIDTIEQYADIIYSTSNNTYRLLENLLSWALMQQGKIPFLRKSLIFKEMVNEVFELLKVNAMNKNISMINLIDENLIIHADVNMIKTVIRNLVSNAIKYTSSEGTIEVSAISKGAAVQVTVKDNGTGIKAENINKLFQTGSDFTRRGTENESGTGLGLILCKEFIEKHRGSIWVESEMGKGSEFKFMLPV
jgi:PAS domain S-box-containing protein